MTNSKKTLAEKITEETKLIKSVFSTNEGMKVLSILCRECFCDLGKYEQDAYKASYKSGQINIIMYILKSCNIPVERFLSIIQNESEDFDLLFR